MAAYYNEVDPYAAQWLRNLIAAGHIAAGDVDERSIVDVQSDDLRGYDQCHFFAGIGGWSHALRLAGWPDDRPVWSGSCPCQDFSVIGKRAGFAGDRDLWPAWYGLIRERRPHRIFGEQVDGAPEWLDRTAGDLERIDYACGAVVIPALAAGAQHERQRLYFSAHPNQAGRPHAQGITAAEARPEVRRPACLAHRETARHLRRPLVPDQSWIVDGLSGEGFAVSAYGNAIHAGLAAEFICASVEAIDRGH